MPFVDLPDSEDALLVLPLGPVSDLRAVCAVLDQLTAKRQGTRPLLGRPANGRDLSLSWQPHVKASPRTTVGRRQPDASTLARAPRTCARYLRALRSADGVSVSVELQLGEVSVHVQHADGSAVLRTGVKVRGF